MGAGDAPGHPTRYLYSSLPIEVVLYRETLIQRIWQVRYLISPSPNKALIFYVV
jgi:hypothetical protein